jgi:hypothetical protein
MLGFLTYREGVACETPQWEQEKKLNSKGGGDHSHRVRKTQS